MVARLDPASKASEGADLELWLDATKIKLFDPSDGRSLSAPRSDGAPSAARGADGASGGISDEGDGRPEGVTDEGVSDEGEGASDRSE